MKKSLKIFKSHEKMSHLNWYVFKYLTFRAKNDDFFRENSKMIKVGIFLKTLSRSTRKTYRNEWDNIRNEIVST